MPDEPKAAGCSYQRRRLLPFGLSFTKTRPLEGGL
jgi:hypothetical protein